jgi:hypothetical protein
LRLLARDDLGAARVVVATTTAGANAAVPAGKGVLSFAMPRFSPVGFGGRVWRHAESGRGLIGIWRGCRCALLVRRSLCGVAHGPCSRCACRSPPPCDAPCRPPRGERPQVEVAHLLHFYHERGMAEAPSASQVEKLRAITNGSGADLRRIGLRSAQLDTNTL